MARPPAYAPMPTTSGGLGFLEHRRLEPVALQQFVEFRTIALREQRGLRDVAAGDLEQPYQVIELELLARLLEGDEGARILAPCALHERRRDHRRRGDCPCL